MNKQHDTVKLVCVTGGWKCWTKSWAFFCVVPDLSRHYEGQSNLVYYYDLYLGKINQSWSKKNQILSRPWGYHSHLCSSFGLYMGMKWGVMEAGLGLTITPGVISEEF